MQTCAVILAAGAGTRMKSRLPKVMHPLCGKPMLWHVSRAAGAVTDKKVAVIGAGSEQVRDYFGEEFIYVLQEQQLGTGHALQQALSHLPQEGQVLVLCGDTPLLQGQTLQEMMDFHRAHKASATVLTAVLDDPGGYGRIVRDASGKVRAIVEQPDASPEELAIGEINTGSYCFEAGALQKYLPRLQPNPRKGEYYLTDLLPHMLEAGLTVEAFVLPESRQALGINDRLQLSRAAELMRKRINEELMLSGVTMPDPSSCYIDASVTIGMDTIIYPQTILEGETRVGENCRLGPGTHLQDSSVGNGVTCRQSVVVESSIGDGSQVGPFAYLRPGSNIGEQVKIGDFVEVKNSTIGKGSKVPHLSYVGDASIGAGVNMGAGSIVVNYDGRRKYRTDIEDGAFIGCNSSLISPLSVGKGAFIGAGSTITRDVPAGSLTLSRSPQEVKENLAERFLGKKEK